MAKGKLNNLINYTDFVSNWKARKANKTNKTETALDVLAQTGKGEDVEKKNVVDKSKTVSNGLAKVVVRTSGDYNDGEKHVSDNSKTVSNGLAKEVVK
jgi:hypothetical protein